MEERRLTVIRYVAVAAIAAIVGGLFVFAFLGPSKDEVTKLVAERDSLRTEAQALKEKVRPLETDLQSLQKKNAELAVENEALAKKFAGLGQKVTATAAEREKLAHKLEATGKGLDEAKARAAELNKAYETLLKEQQKLVATDEAHRAELETTRKALEKAQAEVARLTGARGIYTVQTGDHLSKIAAFFYHNGHRWRDIFEANAFLVSNPDLIYPRMVLIIPQ